MNTFKKSIRLLLAAVYLGAVVHPVAAEEASAKESDDDGVFVTLTRTSISNKNLPTNTEILTQEQSRTWSAQSAGDAVGRMTSTQVNKSVGLASTQNIQMRGASTDQNLVLIDGRPIGGIAFASSQDLSEIPIDTVDHFEVVRGGVSSLYGTNAMGGVLNIITKRGPQDGKTVASAGYEYGSWGRNIFRASAGAKAGPVTYSLYGNTQRESGFRDNGQAETTNIGANADVALPGPAGKLSFDGSFYTAELGSPFTNTTPPDRFNNDIERRTSYPNSKQNTDTTALRVGYTVPLPMDSLLTIRGWGSNRRVIYKDPDHLGDTDRLETSRGAEIQGDLPYGFTLGANFIHDREDSIDYVFPNNSFIASAENYALFIQEKFDWKSISVIPGVRYDHHYSYGDSTNPRVQVVAGAAPWLRFSGSAARAFRAPKIDDAYYPLTDYGVAPDFFSGRSVHSYYGGNPDIQPEKAWTYDAGFELYNDIASFKATYFRANVTNLIQTTEIYTTNSGTPADPDISRYATFNIGSARRQGGEFQIDHRWNKYLKEGVNYTYLQNVGTPNGFSDYVVLPYSPRHTVNGFLTVSPLKSVDINQNVRYVSSRYSGNNKGGTKLDEMFLWDMRLAYRWKAVDMYFQVNDVTDHRYTEVANFPLPGRTFIGGASLHFGGPENPS